MSYTCFVKHWVVKLGPIRHIILGVVIKNVCSIKMSFEGSFKLELFETFVWITQNSKK